MLVDILADILCETRSSTPNVSLSSSEMTQILQRDMRSALSTLWSVRDLYAEYAEYTEESV